ncbi:thioredoxin [Apibacter muscae]|uniref:thioredoxin n=1 Tax=Apibacter muscae TaxID=2509004 RepID=UPI0011AD89F0|nr:thioredoxin [Apibacter muscae]TWP22980.1 thioredoxin [Apibacter muscae]
MKSIIFVAIIFSLILNSCERKDKTDNKQIEKKVSMKTIPLNIEDFKVKIMDYQNNPDQWKFLGNKPAIIDFYADWCGPCKMVTPILEELAAEYEGKIDVYKVDTEKEQELAAMFGIRSIPSLLFIPMDGEPQMVQGAISKKDFENIIKEIIFK